MAPESRPERNLVRQTLIILGIAALFGAGLFILGWGRHIFFLAFAGILVAVFLQTLAGWLHQYTRLRYGWSLAVTVLALLIVIGLLSWLIGARLSQQTRLLSEQLPSSFTEVWTEFQNTALGQILSNAAPQAGPSLLTRDVLTQAAGFASGAVQFAADVIVVLFVGLYGAAQPDLYLRGFLHLITPAKRERAEQVLGEMVYTIRWWLLGQLFAMAVVGVLTGVGLWLIGVKLSLVLGVLAFLLEIVPYLGPFLALIPAVLLAWVESPWMALWVVGLFAGIHVVEGYVVMPLVQLRTIRLPPGLQILALVLFFWAGGILGIFIATPLVITVLLLVRMLYVEDVLGDWSAAPPGRERHHQARSDRKAG